MLMGEICTRSCRFCAVKTALRGQPLRKDEVPALVKAVSELGLRYVTLTSVDRDDLEDRGAGHFASCVSALKQNLPELKVEALIPDYTGAELDLILGAGPDVLAHNIETVPSLQNRVRDRRASFEKSLVVLREAKLRGRNLFTKTGLLLGLGESPDEVLTVMDTLRLAAVDLLTLGQYLRPTAVQLPVEEYLSPGQFGALKKEALARGFLAVTASPLARTSYHAGDFPRGAPHAL
jgi:lipoic acid synthetase